jgi:hypothetical protein
MEHPSMTPLDTQQDPESLLRQLMLQIQQRQAQPLVPDDPLAQLGSVLSGFAAGTQGKPNPALEQYRQQRKDELSGLHEQAGLASSLATIADRRQSRQAARQQAIDTTLTGLLKSDSPDARMYAGRFLQQRLKTLGAEMPDDVVVSLGTGKLKLEDYKEVGVLMGAGVSDDIISRRTGVALDLIPGIRQSMASDDSRKLLGLPTKAEDAAKAIETQNKWLEGLTKQRDLSIPKGIEPSVFRFGLSMFKKLPDELTKDELSAAADAAIKHDLERDRLRAGLPPMPVEAAKVLSSGEGTVAALESVKRLLQNPKSRAVLAPFIGPVLTGATIREAWVRNAPESLTGPVPIELSELGFAEAQIRNLLMALRAGLAVTESEEKRVLEEAPSRKKDKLEVYEAKLNHMIVVAGVLSRRMTALTSVGGRVAANPVDVIRNNPIPGLNPGRPALEKTFHNPKTGEWGRGRQAPGPDWVEIKP